MVLAIGVDIGIHSTKSVILRDSVPLSYSVLVCGVQPAEAIARAILPKASEEASTPLDHLALAITGRGRFHVSVGHQVADSVCLAKSTGSLCPSATVLDVGAEKVLAVRCLEGQPVKSVHNDKCAAGTGRFMQRLATALQLYL